ncbi:hypothetical protein ADM99_15525 [Leptolinea tardivitalis]|uniref:Uncharacterized protein n=1 Tax=Leptolinea tardivitalis TaxID=229920 RepID=A0A0P6XNI0_9CHLR|nr:hypothetical protein ADM99_15525 [Leptolinea tardivitalis]
MGISMLDTLKSGKRTTRLRSLKKPGLWQNIFNTFRPPVLLQFRKLVLILLLKVLYPFSVKPNFLFPEKSDSF